MTVTASVPAEPSETSDPAGSSQRRRLPIVGWQEFFRVLPELTVASIIVNALALALPLGLLQIYDRVVPHHSISTLWALILGVGVALILEALAAGAREYIVAWVGAHFDHRISCKALRHVMAANIVDFDQVDVSARLEGFKAAAILRQCFGSPYAGQTLLALIDLPFVVIFLGVIGAIAGGLVVVPLVLGGLLVVLGAATHGAVRQGAVEAAAAEERRLGFLSQLLQGLRALKTLTAEALLLRRYEALQEANVALRYRHGAWSQRTIAAASVCASLGMVLIAGFGARMVVDNQLTLGGLAAVVVLCGRTLAMLGGGLAAWPRVQGARAARDRLMRLLEVGGGAAAAMTDHVDDDKQPALPPIAGAVRLDNVLLRYLPSPMALFSGLSIDVPPGGCVAIVGDSGQGKSSLLAMMAGLVKPTRGRVLVDGYDLADYVPSRLSDQIAFLPQEGVLFEGTILDNITLYDPDRVGPALELARDLGLDRIVGLLPRGYDTWVGDSIAETLPAGFRQRIAIVRALARQPKVILFDEASIGLDAAGETALRRLLTALKGRCTLVLVTDRVPFLSLADQVYTLAEGRLSRVDRAPAAGLATVVSAAAVLRPPARRDPGAVVLAEPEPLSRLLVSRFRIPTDLSTCLVALLTALDWRGSPRQLAEALPQRSDALDLTGLLQVMSHLDYVPRSARARLDHVTAMGMPCLFIPDDGAAQILLHETEDGVVVFDGGAVENTVVPRSPTRGTVYWFDEQEPAWTAAAADPDGFWRVMTRFRRLVTVNLVVSMAIAVLALAVPGLLIAVFDRAIPAGDVALTVWLPVGAALALVVEGALRLRRGRIIAHIGARLEFILATGICRRILGLPVSVVERGSLGSTLARLEDFEFLRELFVGATGLLFYELPLNVVYLIILGFIKIWLPVALIAIGGIFAVLGWSRSGALGAEIARSSRAGERRSEFLTECLSKMRAIKQVGLERLWFERFRALSARAMDADLAAQSCSRWIAGGARVCGALMMVTALAASSLQVLEPTAGPVAAGVIIAALLVTDRLIQSWQLGLSSVATLLRARDSVRRTDALMALGVERDITRARHVPPPVRGDLSFARVSFRYDDDADPALLGISFQVSAGQVIGITGPTGGGKSTLLKLIAGLYQPQAGTIRIDGTDISRIDPWDLRTVVGFAQQRHSIFNGTVADNLRLANPTAGDEDLRRATDLAGLTTDIFALPDDFATVIGDGWGGGLPRGFCERLSLARLYLGSASLILFDDPGFGLDAATDQAFQRAVGLLRQRATILIVSSNPDHLRLADDVIYLEDGYIRQTGRYGELSNLIPGSQAS
ncbi:MAG: ATP-binding cassette domain-containing protein [Azospirillaceae bacterium]|nr:ATP-binding cassette domain-containing protein [Azospirillaceae bacterium]